MSPWHFEGLIVVFFFITKIIRGTIDSSYLLSNIYFRVPRSGSRTSELLALPTPRTNMLFTAPMYHCALNVNSVCDFDF